MSDGLALCTKTVIPSLFPFMVISDVLVNLNIASVLEKYTPRTLGNGLTIAEVAEATGLEIVSGHVVGTVKKGLIEVIGEREIQRPSKRKVDTYEFVTDEPQMNAEGKPWNYTDNEKQLLAVAKTFEGPFTLAELAAAMGKERLTSGSVNSLVNKKGTLRKGSEVKFMETISKTTVNVYCPDTLKIIEENAFYAAGLQYIYLPEGLETISESAFYRTLRPVPCADFIRRPYL